MNQPVANRNPYGAWYMTPGGLPSPVNDPGPAIARARKKLRQIREHPETEQPLRSQTRLTRIAAFLLIATGVPLLAALAFSGNDLLNEWWMYGIVLLPALLVIPPVVWSYVQTHSGAFARSPETVLRHFLEPFRSRTMGAANPFTVSCDNDDFARFAPRLPGRERTNRYRLNDEKSRREYWSEAMFDGAHWQILHITDVRSAAVAPDLALVDACLNVVVRGRSPVTNALLTGWFVPISLVWALPLFEISFITELFWIGLALVTIPVITALGFQIYKWSGGHAHQFRLRKLIVQVHGEWRVFNGELQGPEEGDLSWLVGTQPQE